MLQVLLLAHGRLEDQLPESLLEPCLRIATRGFGLDLPFEAALPGLLSNQGEKRHKLVFHNGSFKKQKVLKYGTPKLT